MNTNNLVKGDDLMVFIGGKSIACSTSHTISLNQNINEIACKDLNGWSTGVVGAKSWECTTENLMCKIASGDGAYGYNNLLEAYINSTEVDIIFTVKEDEPEVTTNSNLIYNPDLTNIEIPILKGKAIITSLQITASSGDNATLSATFKGINEIEKVKPAPTSKIKVHTTDNSAIDVYNDGGTTYTRILLQPGLNIIDAPYGFTFNYIPTSNYIDAIEIPDNYGPVYDNFKKLCYGTAIKDFTLNVKSENCYNGSYMFSNCAYLETIRLPYLKKINYPNSYGMFLSTPKLNKLECYRSVFNDINNHMESFGYFSYENIDVYLIDENTYTNFGTPTTTTPPPEA